MNRVKTGFLFAVILYLAIGCASLKQPPSSMQPEKSSVDTLSTDWAKVEEKTLALIQYSEQSEAWRHWARDAYHNYDRYQKSHNGKIASKDLLEIKRMGNRYADELWHPLWGLMLRPHFFMDLIRDVKIQTHRETHIEKGVIRYVDSLNDVMEYEEDPVDGTVYEKVLVDVHHINPLDRRGQIFLREFEISFGAALVLMDNFVSGWEPYMNNRVIRRNLFYDHQGARDDTRQMIKAIWNNYRGYRNSEKWSAAFDLYQKTREVTQSSEDTTLHPQSDQLTHLIETSPTYKWLEEYSRSNNIFKQVAGNIDLFIRQQRDDLDYIGNHTTHIASKTFGNSVGLFQSREGKLKNLPETEVQKIENKLKPLDILFEKTPFRLTDKFIPGHYGHVAVWMGTESELRELGVWEQLSDLYHAAVERYSYQGPSFQQSIRNGKHIVEAIRPGVQMSSMRQFLDIDDLAVIRPKDCPSNSENSNCLTLEKKRRYLLEAFRQVGKEYDFNFDVNTESEIVCSEMAYRTFVDLDFSTTRTFGKHSMSPDQVALMADDPADFFYPVLIYFDGKFVPAEGESLRRVFNLLLEKEYSEVEEAIE